MMTPAIIYGLLGLIFLMAAISLVVSLQIAMRVGNVLPRLHGSAELATQVNNLRLQQADTLDKLEHWTRRDRVRRLREGQERAAEETIDDEELVTGADLKRQLRQMAGLG